MTPPANLTIIIPFHDEEHNVLPVLKEVFEVLGPIGLSVICVDDASQDATPAALKTAKTQWPGQMIILTHSERAGKSAALFSALAHVRTDWVQLLDGDGQNTPADTLRVWQRFQASTPPGTLGLVAGQRQTRNDGGFKWLQSRLANGLRKWALNDAVSDSGCGWKLIRTTAFRQVPYFAASHRFLPALIRRAGWDVVEEPVGDRKRWSGRSKYGFLGRAVAGFFDLMGVIWLVRRGRPAQIKCRDHPTD